MSFQLLEYPDRELMMIDLASRLTGELNAAVTVNGAASFAVPGGSTPGPVFDALCAADLDWSKVTVLPGDERWVPETSPHSNAALVRSRLLVDRAAKAQFLPLYLDGRDGADSVSDLSEQLKHHLPLSVVLLGMGGDMHTASLFPGDMSLAQQGDAVLQFVPVPGLDPKVPRMSLTTTAINAAMHKHVVITGADKRKALETAAQLNDAVKAPISAVLSGATVHWAE